MGYIELMFIVCVIAVITAFFIFGMESLSPKPIHPYVVNLLWFICILLIVVVVATAFGLIGRDIQIPRLR